MSAGPRTSRAQGWPPRWLDPRSLAGRPPLVLVLASFAAAGWLTLDLILGGPLSRVDDLAADRIGGWQVGDDNAFVYGICWTITQVGGQRVLILIVMAVLVGYLCWTRRTLQPLVRTLVALALLTVTVYAFKYGLGRTAPEYPGGSFLHREGQSYPSGHTANAVLMWGLATWLAVYYGLPRRVQRLFAVLFVVSPSASALTMLLLNFHWVTDLVTGAAVGIVALWAVQLVFGGPLGAWTGFPDGRESRARPPESAAALPETSAA